jgi:hypothetical protein
MGQFLVHFQPVLTNAGGTVMAILAGSRAISYAIDMMEMKKSVELEM